MTTLTTVTTLKTLTTAFSHLPALLVFHLFTALLALCIGAAVLLRRKGTGSHRVLGWAWVVAMGSATVTSAFIRDTGMLNVAGFTPIHLLTLLVAVQLPRAVWFARHGNVVAHRRIMRRIYFGGCVVAGLFTLMPGRFLGTLLWKHALGVMA